MSAKKKGRSSPRDAWQLYRAGPFRWLLGGSLHASFWPGRPASQEQYRTSCLLTHSYVIGHIVSNIRWAPSTCWELCRGKKHGPCCVWGLRNRIIGGKLREVEASLEHRGGTPNADIMARNRVGEWWRHLLKEGEKTQIADSVFAWTVFTRAGNGQTCHFPFENGKSPWHYCINPCDIVWECQRRTLMTRRQEKQDGSAGGGGGGESGSSVGAISHSFP